MVLLGAENSHSQHCPQFLMLSPRLSTSPPILGRLRDPRE